MKPHKRKDHIVSSIFFYQKFIRTKIQNQQTLMVINQSPPCKTVLSKSDQYWSKNKKKKQKKINSLVNIAYKN